MLLISRFCTKIKTEKVVIKCSKDVKLSCNWNFRHGQTGEKEIVPSLLLKVYISIALKKKFILSQKYFENQNFEEKLSVFWGELVVWN